MGELHTPGPWHIAAADKDFRIRSHGEPGKPIASLWLNGDDVVANARLIAAAPDLREALDSILQYFADHGSTIPSNYIERGYQALEKAAQRDMAEGGR